ncbi:hypothetical protein PoB_001669600 [Plakobranchus ocellatus]|uniref:Transposable element P transposase-like GTP-binding insertion domain-containing protein n=1 Tax=Plakobranchus ocellatus TaxID=259542 RepID=A0AAV3Z6F7_9GAST|nr:hypothetical protein PoB_001669600 [Plakobranchus ocellatus]
MPQLSPTTSGESSVVSAKWTHLSELDAEESKTMVKFTKSSVSPSNIEKQKASLAFNVFSEKTSSALKSSAASNFGWQETAVFIDHVLRLWKFLNTKTLIENIRMWDSDRCAVDLSPTAVPPRCSAVIGQNLISTLGLQMDGSKMEICAVTHEPVDIVLEYPCLMSNKLDTSPDYQHKILFIDDAMPSAKK